MTYPNLLAQSITNPVLQGISGISGAEFFSRVIPNFITLIFVVGILVFVLYFMFGAISWITSGGDKTAAEIAKHRISQAVIGLFILLLIFAILNLIELFFGIKIKGFDISTLRITG